jgi:hypothetical protein
MRFYYWVKWFEDEHLWHLRCCRTRAEANEVSANLRRVGALKVTVEKETR